MIAEKDLTQTRRCANPDCYNGRIIGDPFSDAPITTCPDCKGEGRTPALTVVDGGPIPAAAPPHPGAALRSVVDGHLPHLGEKARAVLVGDLLDAMDQALGKGLTCPTCGHAMTLMDLCCLGECSACDNRHTPEWDDDYWGMV